MIPNKINVYGVDYDVVIQKENPLDDVKNWAGRASQGHKKIWINSKFETEDQIRTFLHELIHVILFETGAFNVFSRKKTELIADSISGGIHNSLDLLKSL